MTNGAERLKRYDAVLEKNGVSRNVEKDVDLGDRMTGLGCDFDGPRCRLDPNAAKELLLYRGLLDLAQRSSVDPDTVGSAIGVVQWFALLARPYFAVFDELFVFVREPLPSQPQPLPLGVASEFLAGRRDRHRARAPR